MEKTDFDPFSAITWPGQLYNCRSVSSILKIKPSLLSSPSCSKISLRNLTFHLLFVYSERLLARDKLSDLRRKTSECLDKN